MISGKIFIYSWTKKYIRKMFIPPNSTNRLLIAPIRAIRSLLEAY